MPHTWHIRPAVDTDDAPPVGRTCHGGLCTSCNGAVAWARLGSGPWRLFDAVAEHDCPSGGYRPGRRPRRRDGRLSEGRPLHELRSARSLGQG